MTKSLSLETKESITGNVLILVKSQEGSSLGWLCDLVASLARQGKETSLYFKEISEKAIDCHLSKNKAVILLTDDPRRFRRIKGAQSTILLEGAPSRTDLKKIVDDIMSACAS